MCVPTSVQVKQTQVVEEPKSSNKHFHFSTLEKLSVLKQPEQNQHNDLIVQANNEISNTLCGESYFNM